MPADKKWVQLSERPIDASASEYSSYVEANKSAFDSINEKSGDSRNQLIDEYSTQAALGFALLFAAVTILFIRRRPSRPKLATAVVVGLSACALLFGSYPWTRSQCLRQAAGQPTGEGVRLARSVCMNSFQH